jgi:hypothetical protein
MHHKTSVSIKSTLKTRCVYLEGIDFPIRFGELARVVVYNCNDDIIRNASMRVKKCTYN